MCAKDGDTQLLDTFLAGKDLYAEIASKAFNYPYEECLEFYPDGSTNADGKERRSNAKRVMLGVLYGRGTKSVAEQLNCSIDKAVEIKESVFKAFPAIREFEQRSKEMAYTKGYVTTVCGRKRRLPDIQLDEFEFKFIKSCETDDLLNFDLESQYKPVSQDIKDKYLKQLNRANLDRKRQIIANAKKYDDIEIKDNGGFIAQAERQCVNARIQGGAADLTKLAMIELANCQEMQDLGFRLLIPVHDELIGECPRENAKRCSELLAENMSKAAEKILQMPIKCDVVVTECWYGEQIDLGE